MSYQYPQPPQQAYYGYQQGYPAPPPGQYAGPPMPMMYGQAPPHPQQNYQKKDDGCCDGCCGGCCKCCGAGCLACCCLEALCD
ncbi:hypothetical protein JCM5350_004325 [Sporobolomyces pararoseus]